MFRGYVLIKIAQLLLSRSAIALGFPRDKVTPFKRLKLMLISSSVLFLGKDFINFLTLKAFYPKGQKICTK